MTDFATLAATPLSSHERKLLSLLSQDRGLRESERVAIRHAFALADVTSNDATTQHAADVTEDLRRVLGSLDDMRQEIDSALRSISTETELAARIMRNRLDEVPA